MCPHGVSTQRLASEQVPWIAEKWSSVRGKVVNAPEIWEREEADGGERSEVYKRVPMSSSGCTACVGDGVIYRNDTR